MSINYTSENRHNIAGRYLAYQLITNQRIEPLHARVGIENTCEILDSPTGAGNSDRARARNLVPAWAGNANFADCFEWQFWHRTMKIASIYEQILRGQAVDIVNAAVKPEGSTPAEQHNIDIDANPGDIGVVEAPPFEKPWDQIENDRCQHRTEQC